MFPNDLRSRYARKALYIVILFNVLLSGVIYSLFDGFFTLYIGNVLLALQISAGSQTL